MEKIVNCHHFCVWKQLISFVIKECIIPQMVRLCQLKLVWPQAWHWDKKRAFAASVNILAIGKNLFFFPFASFDNTDYKFCRNVVWPWEAIMKTGAMGALVWF